MLDMGFLPDVRSILSRLPKKRQTLFFSATVPSEIQHLCDTMLHDPVRVAIAPDRKTAEGITQKVYPVSDHLKFLLLLHRLLTDEQVNSALVFTKTKQGADKVCSVVERHGFSVERIHGDRSQKERMEALTAFKEGRAKFLVATDINARVPPTWKGSPTSSTTTCPTPLTTKCTALGAPPGPGPQATPIP